MKWTNKDYSEILRSYFQEYTEASKEARKTILKRIKKDIKDSAKKNGKVVPSELKIVRFGLLPCVKPNHFLALEN
jgi:hypothetical protein